MVRRVVGVVAIVGACAATMTSARMVFAKGKGHGSAAQHCTWQLPELRTLHIEAPGGPATPSPPVEPQPDPKVECAKEAKKAEFKRTEFIACLTKHTKRFHDGGQSSADAAEEAGKYCDARIPAAQRNEPACVTDFRRVAEEQRRAELWCQTDAKCLDARRRADDWYACARAVARVDERKCGAVRGASELDQEQIDLRISEECQPRTDPPDVVALYRKAQNAMARSGKPVTKVVPPDHLVW